jgi:hypothetical protein
VSVCSECKCREWCECVVSGECESVSGVRV